MAGARVTGSAKGTLTVNRIWRASEGRWFTPAQLRRHDRWERFKAFLGLKEG